MGLDVVLITGDIFCDLVFTGLRGLPQFGQETYAADFGVCPGGLGANAGVALARLGLKPGLISRVGLRPFGPFLLERLAREGVDLRRVEAVDGPTAVSVSFSNDRDRGFITHPRPSGRLMNSLLWDDLDGARHLLVSGGVVARELLCEARSQGLGLTLEIGWDSACRPQEIYPLLPFVDFFLPNEVEACRLTGASDPLGALHLLRPRVRYPIIKLGSRGAIAFDGDELIRVPALDVQPVDTTGAGDVFAAGLIYGHLRGWELARSLRLANVCGALATLGVGGSASAPRWEQILSAAPDLSRGHGGVKP